MADKGDESTDRKRLQLDLTGAAYGQLQRMKEESGLASNAEVVRQALRHFDWFLKKKKNGQTILVKDQDGEVREVEFLD